MVVQAPRTPAQPTARARTSNCPSEMPVASKRPGGAVPSAIHSLAPLCRYCTSAADAKGEATLTSAIRTPETCSLMIRSSDDRLIAAVPGLRGSGRFVLLAMMSRSSPTQP